MAGDVPLPGLLVVGCWVESIIMWATVNIIGKPRGHGSYIATLVGVKV